MAAGLMFREMPFLCGKSLRTETMSYKHSSTISLGALVYGRGLEVQRMRFWVNYSCMRNQNLQYVTVAVACGQVRSFLYAAWHSVVRKTNEVCIFVRCNLIDILSLQHYVISWKVNLGLACFCVYLRGKYKKTWSRENHDVRWSRLFTYEEPESSVRYRSSCLWT